MSEICPIFVKNDKKTPQERVEDLINSLPHKMSDGQDCVVFPFKSSVDDLGDILVVFKKFFGEEQGQKGVSVDFLSGTQINIPVKNLKGMSEETVQQFFDLCGERLQTPMLRKMYIKRLEAATGVNVSHRWAVDSQHPEGIEIIYKIEGNSAVGRGLDPITYLPDALNKALGEKVFNGDIRGSLKDEPYFILFIADTDMQKFLQSPNLEKAIKIFHHPRKATEKFRTNGNFNARLQAFADAALGSKRPEHLNYNYTSKGVLSSKFETYKNEPFLRPPSSKENDDILKAKPQLAR